MYTQQTLLGPSKIFSQNQVYTKQQQKTKYFDKNLLNY